MEKPFLVACSLAFLAVQSSAAAQVVPRGEDALVFDPLGALEFGLNRLSFANTPIPAGTFGPGSDAYGGRLVFGGGSLPSQPAGALSGASMLVRRSADTLALMPGASAVVPARIVALHLASRQPIEVTYGGQSPTLFDVTVTLSAAAPPPPGSATIELVHPDGGVIDYQVPVMVRLEFSQGGATLYTIPSYGPLVLLTDQLPWALVGGPAQFDRSSLGIEPIPTGVAVDGDLDGQFEYTTLGSSSLQIGVARDCAGAFQGETLTGQGGQVASWSIRGGTPGDFDGDGWPDAKDNCPYTWNPRQEDENGNGIGDACEPVHYGGPRVLEWLVSHLGADDREFLELAGDPGASLDDIAVLIVEGDGQAAGTLDRVVDLTGQVVPADGLFVIGDAGVPTVDLVLGQTNAFENGTQTLYLVRASNLGAVLQYLGADVDPDNDRRTLLPCLVDEVLDRIALWDGGPTDRVYDGAFKLCLGPESPSPGVLTVPPGIFRNRGTAGVAVHYCSEAFLPFDLGSTTGPLPTPGEPNPDCMGCFSGHPMCLGNGTGTPCPCGNTGGFGEGCAHSSGAGAVFTGVGSPSLTADTWQMIATQLPPHQFGTFLQGTQPAAGGAGVLLGDGLRCVAGSLLRLETTVADGVGVATSSLSVAASTGVLAGSTRYYQYWFRDPIGAPCGNTANLTSGWQVTWLP